MSDIKADTSRLLMSDTLKGLLPDDFADDGIADLEQRALLAVVFVRFGSEKTAVTGIVRSVLFEAEPELEVRVSMEDALNVAAATDLQVLGFEVHHRERVIAVDGPFVVKGIRVDDVDLGNQMCGLSLGLKRPAAAP